MNLRRFRPPSPCPSTWPYGNGPTRNPGSPPPDPSARTPPLPPLPITYRRYATYLGYPTVKSRVVV